MNDKPNEIEWKIGSIVIHDADQTCKDMLMIVTGHDKEKDLYRTIYVNPNHTRNRDVWKNDKKYLHDPARFGIDVMEIDLLKDMLVREKSVHLTTKYSGDNSVEFWDRVNALTERHGELYALGVVLQNLEGSVIKALADAEKEERDE